MRRVIRRLARYAWVVEAAAFDLVSGGAARSAPLVALAPAADGGKVSIVIPFRDKPELLRTCVESIFARTDYANYQLVLVDNQSALPETQAYLAQLATHTRVKIHAYDQPFNYAALHNWIVPQLDTELVLLLNDDTEVITRSWLGELVAQIEQPGIGAVGALLLAADGSVQHAGVGVGLYRRDPFNVCFGAAVSGKHARRINSVTEYAAVTGACMLTRKSLYQRVGGLDAEHLAINYNDVDYCLRLREHGYRIVYTPGAQLYHHESSTRGPDDASPLAQRRAAAESKYFRARWRKYRNADPFFTWLDDL